MEQPEKQLTGKESLDLIASMINKAKDACHKTGIAAIMWGAVIAICSLIRLSEIHFGYKLPFDIYLLTFVAVIPQVFLAIRESKNQLVKSYGDEFMNYLWIAFGICIFLMIYSTNVMYSAWQPVEAEYRQLTGHASSFHFFEFNSSFFLLLYGLPTFVSGVSMKFKPMLLGGIFCWVCCIVALYTNIKIDLILMALSSFFAWFIPGIIMEKDYRKAKKALAGTHV
jgi:hypothetical protein